MHSHSADLCGTMKLRISVIKYEGDSVLYYILTAHFKGDVAVCDVH